MSRLRERVRELADRLTRPGDPPANSGLAVPAG